MIIRKSFKLEMGHRVVGSYTTGCQSNHGHSAVVELFLEAKTLDHTGMIIDFTEVKDLLGDFFNQFDHRTLVWDQDVEYLEALEKLGFALMIVPYNSTAENISKHMYQFVREALKNRVRVASVRYHETVTGYAEYFVEDYDRDAMNNNLFDLSHVFLSEATCIKEYQR